MRLNLEQAPDLLALAAHNPTRYPALFQSLGTTDALQIQARWDFLAFASGEKIVAKNADATQFFPQLEAALATLTGACDATLEPPFRGGWVVYLGYELSAEIEPTLTLPPNDFGFPRAIALRTPGVIAVNRATGAALLVCEPGFDALIAEVLRDLHPDQPANRIHPTSLNAKITVDAPQHFLNGVQKIHDYLNAGDVFQANLSRAWRAELNAPAPAETSAAQIYANLRAANPAPFAALLQLERFAIISSSPERLIESRGGCAQTRPIAGTRAREIDDAPLSAEQIAAFVGDIKERAEHIMLIDLERNDLGRVCEPGSIVVDELLTVESYAHVHHLVSNVRGRLRPGITPVALLKAVFPGGTITGCPKVRCMEIIAELEGTGRGPYTGALGYINSNGDMDFNILIRTLAKVGNTLHFRAGAGIVIDSVGTKEVLETEAKAKGMLRALD